MARAGDRLDAAPAAAAVAAFALLLSGGLLLHLGTGLADQGDFARSTAFLLEGPVAASPLPAAGADARAERAERLRRWDDRWVARDAWDPGRLWNASSYKLVLAAQVAFARAVTGGAAYSMRVGSLPARAVVVAAFAGLLALALAEAPLWGAMAFAALAGALALDSSFAAFLNSAYEDQVAIVFLPALALLAWRAASRPGRGVALGAVVVAAVVGASKAQLVYLPILAAPLLWRALRGGVPRRAAVAALVAAQVVAAAPLVLNPATRVNVYHAAYCGLLPALSRAELREARLGGAPVLRECVGVGAFAAGGAACLDRARHGYRDVLALAVAHPRAVARVIGRALELGPDVELAYLGKESPGVPSFASLPVFGVWRAVFAAMGAGVLVVAIAVSGWLVRSRAAAARAALLMLALGLTQYAVAFADGLVEYPKHVLVGNFAVALGLSIAAVAWAGRARAAGGPVPGRAPGADR